MRFKHLPILSVAIATIFMCAFSTVSPAQTVEISNNSASSQNIVLGSNAYHVSESIFLDSEIGSGNFTTANKAINSLSFFVYVVGAPVYYDQVRIFFKNVPATTSTFTVGDYDTVGYTMMYDGGIYLTTTGWWEMPYLANSFVRTPGSNLAVLFKRTDGVVRTTPFTYMASVGNSIDAAAFSTRRYNGTSMPINNGTSLTPSAVRPAMRFSHTNATDASVTNVLLPTSSCFTAAQTVRVVLTNTGGSTSITPGSATVKLNISGANNATLTATNINTTDPGYTDTIDFTGVNMNNVGFNTYRATVAFTGDENSANDTTYYYNSTTPVTSTFPVVETAENVPSDHIGYTKVLAGSFTWRKQTGKYKNTALSDSLAPHGGNKFYLFDAYSIDGSREIAHTECITLPPMPTGGGDYYVSFWMSHDTSYSSGPYILYDSLYLVISTDKAKTWQRLAGYRRNDPQFTTPGWMNHQYDLPNFQGQTVQIGFEGVSQFGNVIGLDDIRIVAPLVMPVKLISFTGERNGTVNKLQWTTATETNNKGFELQRSIDGINFSAITFVPSKSLEGNSSSTLNYEFTDTKPFASNSYYRLKQTDKDGKFAYSNVVLIKGNKATELSITALYPNPAVNTVTLSVASPVNNKVTIVVTDLAGKVVMQQPAQLQAGDNLLPLDVKRIAKGSYTIKLLCADGCNSKVVRQLVKQ